MAPSALHPMSVAALRATVLSYKAAARALRLRNPAASRQYAELATTADAALPPTLAVG